MFAINRILKVKGRIVFLIISIKTIKLINANGVPLGTRCANILLVKLIHPYSIKPTHIGTAIIMLTEICLVPVNKFGIKPIKLHVIKIKKSVINKFLLLSFFVFRAICNCSSMFEIILFLIQINRDGLVHIEYNKKIVGIRKHIQFNSSIILVFGSKDVNSLKIVVFLNSFFFISSVFNSFGFVYRRTRIVISEINNVNIIFIVLIGRI